MNAWDIKKMQEVKNDPDFNIKEFIYVRNVGYYSVMVQNKDLRQIKKDLICKKFKYRMEGDQREFKRTLTIWKVYKHHCLCIYNLDKNPNYIFRICLSAGDLVEAGVISFKSGYPEVLV